MLKIAMLTKVNTKMIKKMAMESSPGRVEISTKAITKMMNEMAMVKCTGLMDQFIKVNGGEVFSMEWAR